MSSNLVEIWSKVRSKLSPNGAHENGRPKEAGVGSTAVTPVVGKRLEPDVSGQRRLVYQLHHSLPRGERSRSVLIVTPSEPEVAARASVGLARSMAEELQHSVLLVDASDDGTVSRMLGAPAEAGLTDFMASPLQSLDALALSTSHERVSFLPFGRGHRSSVSQEPENLRVLLERAERCWDFVIVAGGAVLTSPVSLALAPDAGHVLLLVTENETLLEDISAAQRTLSLCNVPAVSLVLTDWSAAM